MPQGTAACD